MNAKISKIEYYLPKKIVTNRELSKENPEWDFGLIESKTGILSRHIAAENENASVLAVHAAEKLFRLGGLKKDSVEALIFCTQSPEYPLPTSACIIQDRLNLPKSVLAFDFNQGCSGFIYGLAIGSAFIESKIVDRVLLLCAETYSKYISNTDRTSRTVFGDAAAAVAIERSTAGNIGPFVFGTDGSGRDKLIVKQNRLFMDGPAVFMFSMARVPSCVNELLSKAGKNMPDIDCFIFHQASKIVIDNLVRILSLDESRVFRGYSRIGNTVSASIPIALRQAAEAGFIKKGNLIMLVGFGVGLSWGACLIRW